MYTYRKATEADLPVIYKMQDVPFRDRVYANYLPGYQEFYEFTARKMGTGEEVLYVLERDGSPDGFVEYIHTQERMDIIVWGKWIKTLMYVAMKVAFDQLGCAKVNSAVRTDNERVVRTYREYDIRKIGQEMFMYRQGSILGYLKTANFYYYEMTLEEFRAKEEQLRRQSLDVVIA
jgi:hypothetical protein